MKRKTILIIFIIIYVLSVIVFSLIYTYQWRKNSCSFIIEPQLNQSTFDYYAFHIDIIQPYNIQNEAVPISIIEFNQFIKPFFVEINSNDYMLDSLTHYNEKLEKKRDSLQDLLMESYKENLALVIQNKTRNINDSIYKWENEIIGLENSKTYMISDLGIADANLSIAELRLAIANYNLSKATIEVDIRTEAIKDFSQLQDKTLKEIFTLVQGEYIHNLDHISLIETKNWDIKSSVFKLKTPFTKKGIKDYSG